MLGNRLSSVLRCCLVFNCWFDVRYNEISFVFLVKLSFAFRYQLNYKKGKDEEYPMSESSTYSTQPLVSHLSSDSNNENLKDKTCQMPLSNSLVGGSMDVCKTRILNFIQTERILQGELTF